MRITVFVLAGILACWPGRAAAQEQPYANLFVGGGYLLAAANVAPTSAIGASAAVDFNVTDNISVFFDWGSQVSLGEADAVTYATLGGVRFSHLSPSSGKRFFYHVAAGGVEVDGYYSDTAWAFGAGFGLDVDFTNRVAFRAFQVDSITSFFAGDSQSNFRLASGVVFKLGRR